jgi:superfamily II DNA or RNA helicase
MDAFTSGEAKIICNVGVLAYGWDFPELRNIYNAAPTQSIAKYEQRIGRGTRAIGGTIRNDMTQEERLAAIAASAKPDFNIYDITDSSRAIQLVNALDVLDAASREDRERRLRMMAKMEEGSDVIAEAADQDRIDEEKRLLAAQELKEKRQRLVVGMTFGHEDRDPFEKPLESRKQRGWRMLWGPYKGELIRDLPTGYLKAVHGKQKKDSPLVRAIGTEIQNRERSAPGGSS